MTIKQMNIKRFKLPLIFAVLSVVLMGLYKTIFGVENTIIGLIIAMASYAFLRLDLTSYPIYKSMIFLILNLFLAISAYISAINPFVGLIINFLQYHLYIQQNLKMLFLISSYCYMCICGNILLV